MAEGRGWSARRASRVALMMAPLCAVLGACAGGRPPELAKQTPTERATAFDHVAEIAGQEGDGAVAERLYRRAMADRPDWVEPRIGLGHLLLRRGDIEGARAAFERAAQLAPGDGRPVAGLAAVDLAEHRPETALQGFARALRLTPGDATTLNGSGVALDQLGRHAEAQARYREVLARDPDNRAARNNLGLSLALAGRAQEAVEVLSALAQAPTAVPRNRQNLALALALLGRDTEAVATASLDEAPAMAKADIALLDVLRQGLRAVRLHPHSTPRLDSGAGPAAAGAVAMRHPASRRLRALLVAVALLCAVPSGASWAATPSAEPPRGELRLNQAEGRLLHLSRPPASIFLADPSIADIATPTDKTVFIYGKKPGRTSLFALDASGAEIASWRVRVTISDEEMRALVRAKVGNYPVSLSMTPSGAVLSGAVPTPGVAERVRAVAAEFVGGPVVDNLHVTGSLQVQLRVRVAEVSRSVSKELGINWETSISAGTNFAVGLFTGRTFFDTASGLPGLLGGTQPNTIQRSTTNAGALPVSYSHGNTHINSLLDALASESLLRDLAEPTLVTTSGEPAKFLAGGEFPVPVGQGLGQVGIDYKQFGVALSFTPTVVNEDLISMKVAPEVSTLVTDVSSGAITENGFTVPALTVRRAETTVELGSGQSFAIGGLLQNNITSAVSRFPGLGDIPILGALFRSTNFARQETELVIIVTPTIVRPVARPDEERLPTAEVEAPSDLELILRAKLSAAPGGAQVLQGMGTARLRGDMGFLLE